MNVNENPNRPLLIPAFFLFTLVHDVQSGIGFLGFQRIIMKYAGHDAWVSVILAGLFTHLVLWIMIKTLQAYPSADLYGIHYHLFGKWLGTLLSLFYMIYLGIAALVVLRNYVEMVQAWIFPTFPVWMLVLIILFLALYCIQGGIRTIAGFSFFCVILTVWMLALLYYPLKMSEWNHLFPLFEAKVMDMLRGAKDMTLTIIGFEIIYFIYPFISEKDKVQKYAHLGVLFTTLVYFFVMVVTIMYMPKSEIMQTIWATLNLFKIIQMPFLQRFEFIGVSITLLIVLPNIILFLWAASRGMKRVFHWKQKNGLYAFTFLIFIGGIFLKTRLQINQLNDWVGTYSFYLIFIYPFILFGYQMLFQKFRKER